MAAASVHEQMLTRTVALLGFWKAKMITPQEVIAVLNKSKISFVLVGAYGIAGWLKEPRATEDVDIIVAARQVKKATQLLTTTIPHLEAVNLSVVVRLQNRDTQAVEIDLMKPIQQPYREVFHHTHMVSAGGQQYRVPSLEMAVVMKFAAMTSVYQSEEDKHQDAHDFIHLVKKNPGLDKEKITQLGALIYPEGGTDVLELTRKVQAGEKLNI